MKFRFRDVVVVVTPSVKVAYYILMEINFDVVRL